MPPVCEHCLTYGTCPFRDDTILRCHEFRPDVDIIEGHIQCIKDGLIASHLSVPKLAALLTA